ncbi:MAG: dihydrofolate reductase family protein [Candidatus Pararuminococcus gallinarum]|jgi:riboflavin biosynthesis pyrimidine reductase
MQRPKNVIHILSALDGKITGPFMGLAATRTANREYARIRIEYHADAWLYGTVTTKEFTDHRKPILDDQDISSSLDDFIADREAALYYVSIDALGEIGWESGTFQSPGRPDAHIIEVLTEQASPAYRAYLRRHGVSYIFAGEKSLDCKIACEKLYRMFGIQTMLICGGGGINWTFLQQGMVDELSLLLAPAADGDPDSVTVFEQSPFLSKSIPVTFRLKDVERLEGDAVRLVYTIVDPKVGAQ